MYASDASIAVLLGLGVISVIVLVLITHQPYTPFPILGQLHAFAGRKRQQHLEWFLKGSKHFKGRSWKLRIPFVGTGWVISDPAALKHVLATKHSSFGKGVFFETRARDLFEGDGILIATGDSWKAQRAAGHSFTSPPTLKHFSTVTLPRNLAVLLERLEADLTASDKQPTGSAFAIVDFQDVAMDYSMAVFGEIAFDADWHRLSTQFSQPFHSSSSGISHRFKTPFYTFFEQILPYGKTLRGNLDKVHAISRELVKESLEAIDLESEGGLDIEAAGLDKKGLLVKKLIEGGITDEEKLADSCLNYLTAGRDTTGQAITWTLYALLCHPEYIGPITDEIDNLRLAQKSGSFASSSSSRLDPLLQPSTSLEKDLPRLEAAISESLRLHPPIPLEILENTSSEPIILPDEDHTIVSPGEQVLWSPWVMARLPFWGPDAGVFNPERWMTTETSEAAKKPRPTAFESPVFHAGPRSCVGQPLARAELIFALSEVLGRYEFELVDDGKGKEVGNGLTSPMVGGLVVRVRRRNLV